MEPGLERRPRPPGSYRARVQCRCTRRCRPPLRGTHQRRLCRACTAVRRFLGRALCHCRRPESCCRRRDEPHRSGAKDLAARRLASIGQPALVSLVAGDLCRQGVRGTGRRGFRAESASMSIMRAILMRMFGRPRGALGRLGGLVMARMNADCGAWVVELLEVGPTDRMLEVGFGPGVVVQHLSQLVSAGHVAGVDALQVMVKQARARNATSIRDGRVELRYGLVEALPFDDGCFDKALAINSLQLWP